MNRISFEPGPLVDVSYETGSDGLTLVFVRDLRHPPEKVWSALTDPAQLGEWAPYTTDRDLGSTGEMTLTMIDGDTAEDLAAKVIRADRPDVLAYTIGTDLLRWELAATGDGTGTRLTLRHTVGDWDWLPKVAAGWHICLAVAERLLDGRPVGPIRGQEAMQYGWEELRAGYEAKLRAEQPSGGSS